MLKILERVQKIVIHVLLVMIGLAVVLSTVDLGIVLVREIISPPFLLLDITKLLEIFGFFLMILIGIELMQSIKAYLTQEMLQVEVVFMVAMIAIARKVIILDIKTVEGWMMVGLAAIILALAVGYYLVTKAHHEHGVRTRERHPPVA